MALGHFGISRIVKAHRAEDRALQLAHAAQPPPATPTEGTRGQLPAHDWRSPADSK